MITDSTEFPDLTLSNIDTNEMVQVITDSTEIPDMTLSNIDTNEMVSHTTDNAGMQL